MKFKIIFVLIFLFISCSKEEKTASTLLNFAPENASIIIKINNQGEFLDGLKINDFIKTQEKKTIYNSILKKTKSIDYSTSETQSLLAFSELGKDNYEFTYVTRLNSGLKKLDSIKKIVEIVFFENTNYTKYLLTEIDSTVVYTINFDNTIILSSSSKIIEDLIRNPKGIEPTKKLGKLYQVSNETKPASIFINMKNSNSLVSTLLKDKDNTLSNFSDWVSLDMALQEESVRFSGISTANDSLKNYIDLFKNIAPLPNTTASFAPEKTNAILSYTFDNYSIFAKNQKEYLNQEVVTDSIFNTVEEIGSIYFSTKKAIVLSTYGSELITEFLSNLKTNATGFQGSEIIALSKNDFLNTYFNPLIQDFSANYYTVINNSFIFSSDIKSLQTIIHNYKSGSTFDKTAYYKTAKKSIAEESNILFISNAKGITHLIKGSFLESIYDDFKKSKLSDYVFASQIVTDANFYHSNFSIQKVKKERISNTITSLFNVHLESDIATEPQFITNHKTYEKEIIVQDIDNTLYLISNKGHILWKKELNGTIQGKITQVDLYKNGKLQLAFTTDSQFLILDRNGEEVAPFSMNFDGGNLNALAVFDYNEERDYRFIITQGSKISMYDTKGEIVDGFTYTTAKSSVIAAPKHFRIAEKDYITFKLENGDLKILHRTGKTRVKVKNTIDFSKNEIYIYKNQFTVTDKKGILHQINSNGKSTTVNLNLNENHGIDATNKTLAIMNSNILSIKGKKVTLEISVYSKPQIFYLRDKIYVSVTDLQNQKIYLFDSNAKPIPNFPVFGASLIDMVDMDNDKSLELVVKDLNNSLVVYRINK
ncbi:MAG: ribonuclease HII [Cellulophaga sp.]